MYSYFAIVVEDCELVPLEGPPSQAYRDSWFHGILDLYRFSHLTFKIERYDDTGVEGKEWEVVELGEQQND